MTPLVALKGPAKNCEATKKKNRSDYLIEFLLMPALSIRTVEHTNSLLTNFAVMRQLFKHKCIISFVFQTLQNNFFGQCKRFSCTCNRRAIAGCRCCSRGVIGLFGCAFVNGVQAIQVWKLDETMSRRSRITVSPIHVSIFFYVPKIQRRIYVLHTFTKTIQMELQRGITGIIERQQTFVADIPSFVSENFLEVSWPEILSF